MARFQGQISDNKYSCYKTFKKENDVQEVQRVIKFICTKSLTCKEEDCENYYIGVGIELEQFLTKSKFLELVRAEHV